MFIIGALVETVTFVITMNMVKTIKQEFSMLSEIYFYAASWLIFTNLILFIHIQGSYSGWLSLTQQNRIRTYLMITRSLVAVCIAVMPPLVSSYKDEFFFPIPPNRECIEQVDTLLHVPVAVDAFYDFLVSRPQ